MARHHLIEDYLAGLARTLPAEAVEELTDGLTETWQHHLATGLEPAAAARVALREFGTGDRVVGAFVAQAPGRRTALMLLTSGPAVGACWGAALVSAQVWTWRLPAAVAVAYAVTLLAVVAVLATAATSRRSYRRTRFGGVGGIGLLTLDAAMLAAVALAAPALAWPMAVAVPASLVRIAFTLRSLPGALTR